MSTKSGVQAPHHQSKANEGMLNPVDGHSKQMQNTEPKPTGNKHVINAQDDFDQLGEAL